MSFIGRFFRRRRARKWAEQRAPSWELLGHEPMIILPLQATAVGKAGAVNIALTTASAHGSLRYGASRRTSPEA